MKQKKLFSVGIIILLILIIIVLVVIQFKNEGELSSFTINLYADYTSSAADRHYTATLVFQDDKLVSGWQKYESGGINAQNYECIVDLNSLTWINKETKQECEGINPPLDKKSILRKIDSGEFKSKDTCEHLNICYEIV